MADDQSQPDLITLTANVVSAFASNNPLRGKELPKLIARTHAALAALGSAPAASEEAPAGPAPAGEFTPAVTARKSLGKREVILSMIDGKPYKTLKRHIGRHGLTPDEYRARYKLPADYPMVAPAYSEARRETAKRLGLGRKPKAAAAPAEAKPPARRGRPPKAQS